MGSSTSCHYSSFGSNNGCSSYPSDSVLSAGAIAGIVIGSLLGIAVIIFLLVLTYKLLKRNSSSSSSSSHVPHYPNVYSVPRNREIYRQSIRRPDMYPPSKSPMSFEPSMNNEFYENA